MLKQLGFLKVGVASAFLLLTSCNVVELDPLSTLTESNFYGSADDLDRAVLGVYSSYQSRIPRDWRLFEISTDELNLSVYRYFGGLDAINNLDFQPQNDLFREFWQVNFNGIFRTNAVLSNLDVPTDFTLGLEKQLEGEAKFMRALYYFDLVRAFGGVPLVTSTITIEESKSTPRASESATYELIISDLKDAISLLPTQDGIARGRASKGAAVALLGKVYVYLKDWQNAETNLKMVSSFGYELLANYADLWAIENEDNSEVIFAMKYLENDNGQPLSHDFIPFFGVEGISPNGGEAADLSWSLHKKFLEEDTRKAATITEYWRSPGSSDPEGWRPYVSKFAVPHTSDSGLDIPVLRFADIVLLHAEALYNLGKTEEALVELNRVRTRAFGNTSHNYELADISSAEEFYDKLLLERQLELALENQRWFDLVRTGRFMSELAQVEWTYNNVTMEAQKVDLEPKSFYVHFPIPQHEIDQSNPGVLLQNEGY